MKHPLPCVNADPRVILTTEEEPVCVYAVGLLARAMDNQDIAASFREKNNQLVPVLLSRLHRYRSEKAATNGAAMNGDLETRDLARPFAEFGKGNATVNGDHSSTPTKNEVGLAEMPILSGGDDLFLTIRAYFDNPCLNLASILFYTAPSKRIC